MEMQPLSLPQAIEAAMRPLALRIQWSRSKYSATMEFGPNNDTRTWCSSPDSINLGKHVYIYTHISIYTHIYTPAYINMHIYICMYRYYLLWSLNSMWMGPTFGAPWSW